MVCCRRGSIAPMLRACRMIDTKIIELIKVKIGLYSNMHVFLRLVCALSLAQCWALNQALLLPVPLAVAGDF
jgi:hypothetical protein